MNMKSLRTKIIVIISVVVSICTSSISYALTRETLMDWGTETLDMLHNEYQLSNGYYAGSPDSTSVTFAWGHGIMFGAVVAAAAVDDSYIAEAEKLAKDIQSGFWCSNGGGYNASKGNCGDRYSDDSAWIVLAMTELYEITLDNRYLEWAKAGCEYIMSCENDENTGPYGGIRWHESATCGTRMCSTSPSCLMNMKLYLATGDWSYVQAGYRLYNWAKDHGARNSTTYIYYEGVNCDGGIDYVQLGYDTAPMLEAIIIMYEVTGRQEFLQEAQHIAHNMVSQFVNGKTHALKQTGKWCGHDMANAFVRLFEADHNYYWIDVVSGYVQYMYENCKADNGLFNTSWDNTTGSGSTDIIDNASPARAFWTLAKCYAGINPTGPVALYNDCSYGGYAVYLDCGEYDKDDLQYYGISDNTISSLKIADGYYTVLYDGSSFDGTSVTCPTDKSCLSDYGWSDRISSIAIKQGCEPSELTSRFSVNGSEWQESQVINVNVGDSLAISPLSDSVDGTWSWVCSNGMKFTEQEINVPAVVVDYSGRYKLTYTNSCGAVSTMSLTVNVENPAGSSPVRGNLALNKNAYANASISGEGPEKAVDGTVDSNSKWCVNSGASTIDWLVVDLGDIYEVDTFVVQHAAAGGESLSWNTNDFAIYTSLDGTDWTKVVNVQDNILNVTRNVISTTLAEYVKLEITDPAVDSNTAVRIYEFEVYGPYDSLFMVGDTSGVSGVSDCMVNIYDFNTLASSWLSCERLDGGTCYDYYDYTDLNLLLDNWLSCFGNGCE